MQCVVYCIIIGVGIPTVSLLLELVRSLGECRLEDLIGSFFQRKMENKILYSKA